MNRVSTALGTVAMVWATGVAHGQDAPSISAGAETAGRPLRVGAFVGVLGLPAGIELGNAVPEDQVPQSGFAFGARAGVKLLDLGKNSALAPRLFVEGEFRAALSSTEGAPDKMRASHSAPVLGAHVHALVDIWGHRKLSPFAVLGVSAETVISDSPFIGDDTDMALYWGGGATYALGERYGLRGDLRHLIAPGRESLAAHAIEFNVGGYFEFSLGGGGETYSKIEHVDSVPVEPKAVDSDGDGINDPDDKCPQQPETHNGIDDEDGCPEIDSDADGLLGSRDACPDAAEDKDGFQDEDGCPDPDNDGDGRPDVVDQCPMEAETMNGFEDDDGCPDEVPAPVRSFTGVIDGIVFDTGKAKIRYSSRKTLDKAAAILKEYPSVRIRITGHTDIKGGRDTNLALSRKRSDYVKWYIVDKGVEADRIETEGYGPDRPIGDNETNAGRAKNRRIEFELLPGPATMPDPRNTPAPSAPATQPSAPAGGGTADKPAPSTGKAKALPVDKAKAGAPAAAPAAPAAAPAAPAAAPVKPALAPTKPKADAPAGATP